jgi:hypothetical protein
MEEPDGLGISNYSITQSQNYSIVFSRNHHGSPEQRGAVEDREKEDEKRRKEYR